MRKAFHSRRFLRMFSYQKQEKDTSFIDFVVYSDEELLEVVKKLNND